MSRSDRTDERTNGPRLPIYRIGKRNAGYADLNQRVMRNKFLLRGLPATVYSESASTSLQLSQALS